MRNIPEGRPSVLLEFMKGMARSEEDMLFDPSAYPANPSDQMTGCSVSGQLEGPQTVKSRRTITRPWFRPPVLMDACAGQAARDTHTVQKIRPHLHN